MRFKFFILTNFFKEKGYAICIYREMFYVKRLNFLVIYHSKSTIKIMKDSTSDTNYNVIQFLLAIFDIQ